TATTTTPTKTKEILAIDSSTGHQEHIFLKYNGLTL
ncbi:hypothetical protein SS7213T_03575, partial [Staphylococcus simiae CCM 7213 = CCUG 51256]